MLTFPDLFWKQKGQKNNFCSLVVPNKNYSYLEIQHKVMGLMSRLYSLGVTPTSLVAVKHNYIEGIFVEWAIWLLGAGIVFWDDNVDMATVFTILEEKKVSHWIVQDEQYFLDYEDNIDELYDMIHVLCLQHSENIIPITASSYDQKDYIFSQKYKENSSTQNIAMFHIQKDQNHIVLHSELYKIERKISDIYSIYIPISRITELRLFLIQHIFDHRIECYQQSTFPYTQMDFCIVKPDFLQHMLARLQQIQAPISLGSAFISWYTLLLQHVIFHQHLSKRVHIQLQLVKFFSTFFLRESMGIHRVGVFEKDSVLQNKLRFLGISFDCIK